MYDERGLQTLGIAYHKHVKRGDNKSVLTAKPFIMYSTKDNLATVTRVGYFKSDKYPIAISNKDLDGSIMIIKSSDKTAIKKLEITEAGVISLKAMDTAVASTGSERMDLEFLQLVGSNLKITHQGDFRKVPTKRGNVIWLYSSDDHMAKMIHTDYWKAPDTASPLEKIAINDKLNQFNTGDLIFLTSHNEQDGTDACMKKITKGAGNAITLSDVDAGGAGESSANRWKLSNIQMIGTSNNGLKSDLKSIRDENNLIKSVTMFLITDGDATVAQMEHADYWSLKRTDIPTEYDVAKVSYVRGNMKTGDLIVLNGSDNKTVIKRMTVNPNTNVIALTNDIEK